MLARLREDRVRFHEGASRVKVALRNLLIPIARLSRCQTNASSVEILGGAPQGDAEAVVPTAATVFLTFNGEDIAATSHVCVRHLSISTVSRAFSRPEAFDSQTI
jgi:hypothetical protein